MEKALTTIFIIGLAAQQLVAQNANPAEVVKPVEKPAVAPAPGTPASSDASKPAAVTPAADVKTPASPAETKPTPETKPPAENKLPLEPEKPVIPPVKKDEPEMDPETKRLIEEAKQKILREKAEKDAAEKRAAEARKRSEEEKNSFWANAKLYAGVAGGVGIPLNSIHGLGYGFGGTVDFILFRQFGAHTAVATGQYSAKNAKLVSGNTTLAIPDTGTFGFLSIDLAAMYTFPQIWGMESAAGVGIEMYKLSGGNYGFNTIFSPIAVLSAYYTFFSRFQAGVVIHMNLPSTKKIQVSGTDYELDSSTGLTSMRVDVSIRYALF